MFKALKEFFFGKPPVKEEVPYKVEIQPEPPAAVVEQSAPQPTPEPVVEAKPKKPRAKKPAVTKDMPVEVKSKPAKAAKAKKETTTAPAIKAQKPRKASKKQNDVS